MARLVHFLYTFQRLGLPNKHKCVQIITL
jgi:hypothetical protein